MQQDQGFDGIDTNRNATKGGGIDTTPLFIAWKREGGIKN